MRRGKRQNDVEWGRGGPAPRRSSSPLFFTRIPPRCLPQCHRSPREWGGGGAPEQSKPRAARQPPGAHLGQAVGPDSGTEVPQGQSGDQGPTRPAATHRARQNKQAPSLPWPPLPPLSGFISGIPNKEKIARPSDPLQSHPWQLGSNITGGACCYTPAQRSWRQLWAPSQVDSPASPDPTSTEKALRRVLARPLRACPHGGGGRGRAHSTPSRQRPPRAPHPPTPSVVFLSLECANPGPI